MSSEAYIEVIYETGHSGIVMANASGQLDESNLPELSSKIDPLLSMAEVRNLVFNFSKLEYLNSKILGYIANLSSEMEHAGKHIAIAEANSAVTDILDLVGLTTLIPCYPSAREAFESFEE